MGGKKRSRDEDYDSIRKKIRKLEKHLKKKTRRRKISSSSERDFLNDDSPTRSSVQSNNDIDITCGK